MTKKLLAGCLTGLFMLGIAGMANALPVTNVAGDGYEDRLDGSVYAEYANSGIFAYINEGGNNDGIWFTSGGLEAEFEVYFGLDSSFVLELANTTSTGAGEASGTWNSSPGDLSFYIVKARNAYAVYEVTPADNSGSWSTFDLWNVPSFKGNSLDISHFRGYNPTSAPVPEPATMLLFGTGIAGLAGVVRRRKNKK